MPTPGDRVYIEVNNADGSRDEQRGIVHRVEDGTATIRYPGYHSMMLVDVPDSEFRVRKGTWRLRRYLDWSECCEEGV